MAREPDPEGGVVAVSARAVSFARLLLALVLLAPTVLAQVPEAPEGPGTPVTQPGSEPGSSNPDPLADLVVYSIGIDPLEPDYEHPVSFCAEFQNYGNADPAPFNVALVVDGEELVTKRYRQFPAEGDRVCESMMLEAGWHSFEAVADFDSEVPEGSEDNNRRVMSFVVGDPPRPDLKVELFLAPDPPRRGETASFTARIRNVGSETANESVLEFVLDGALVARRGIPAIPPQQTHHASVALDGDRLSGGEHVMVVTADAWSNVTELNEENNAVERRFSLPMLPYVDLVLSNVSWSTPVRDSHVATLSAEVWNAGDEPAETFSVRFLLDNRTILGSPRVGGLAPGNTTTVTAAWTARNPGPHALSVLVDATGEVSEANETNNVDHYPFPILPASDVPPAPDLVVDRLLHLPSHPAPGQPVNFTAVLRNAGTVRAGAFDVTFWAEGQKFASSRFTSLAPGAVIASVGTWAPPAGVHNVSVLLDPLNDVNETDEANNEKTLALRAAAPAAAPPPASVDGNGTAPPVPVVDPAAPDPAPGGGGEAEYLLQVSSLGYVMFPGGDGRYAAKIFNTGVGASPPFKVEIYVDGELVGNRSATGVASFRELSFTYGRRDREDFEHPPPGEHELRVVVLVDGPEGPTVVAAKQTTFTVDAPEENGIPAAPAAAALAALAVAALAASRPRRR